MPPEVRPLGWSWLRARPRPAAQLAGAIAHGALRWRQAADQDLQTHAAALRAALSAGRPPDADESLLECGSLVFEAIRRRLGFELYGVQLQAGIVLARGGIAEMATGEGKTLSAALPVCAWGLTGQGVHVATVNQFLADRDSQQLRPVYQTLGLSVALLPERASPALKRPAYQADITYATGYELGFDYLRDQSALWLEREERLGERVLSRLRGRQACGYEQTQRSRVMCIIDEIDSVLIDEARTPLILSGQSGGSVDHEPYVQARQTALALVEGRHYTLEERTGRIELTEPGYAAMAERGASSLALRRPWSVYVRNALRAERLLARDVHYVVQGETIQLVDEFTGRIFADRVLSSGLHQAVEVKEGLTPSVENSTLAKICRQRYFSLYERLCGMTGTAAGSEREVRRLFGLEVSPVPLARASRRQRLPARFFATEEAKFAALADDVAARHAKGQPVLIGSRTIRNSERIAELLWQRAIPLNLLNGKQDLEESEAVAAAGRRGAVTVATNMAGRGTDIRLGPGVEALGGLHVIGVERHESARIDRQLIGRCARQGDPGSCQFFVSAEDELVRLHAPDLARAMARRANPQGEILADLSPRVDRIQLRLEERHAGERRELLREDERLSQLLAKATGVIPA